MANRQYRSEVIGGYEKRADKWSHERSGYRDSK